MKSRYNPLAHNDYKIYKNLQVEKVVPGGDGLVRLDGKVVFVPGVLAGESVDVRLVSEGRKFSRGELTAVNTPSDKRVEPFCPLYGECGGCNFQHIAYGEQLALKESFVREHFSRLAGVTLPEDFRFVPSPERGYRNRVQFHRCPEGAGFKKRGSDQILCLDSCPVLAGPLNNLLASHTRPQSERETFFADETRWWSESGKEEIVVTIDGQKIFFRADLFFQSNLSILPEMLSYALGDSRGHHGMDLYCGVGLFSVFMKQRFSHITAIELNPRVEPFYRKNMGDYSYEFFGQSLEKWLRRKGRSQADFILVDPPRTGLSEQARSFLIQMKVPELCYVSCDPVTQARDTKELLQAGYVPDSARGFDFYPQTHHMETVIRFRRA